MRNKKPAQRSLQSKDFEMNYDLMPCSSTPTMVKHLSEKAKKFIKEFSLTEEKYFEIYNKLSKRNTQESKEYLESCGFDDTESLLVYFNK